MQSFERLLAAFSKNAHRVDDGIHARELRDPIAYMQIASEVGLNVASCGGRMACCAYDYMSGGRERTREMAANETGGAGEQDDHCASFGT
jgi:hypothetical protein